ncbi:hypothetical protein EVAR_6765_1 [Eumeta japonica]|uniref:Uncharacterized protein n=1 Tax=Eumeta variegata TaxID=151549 RepID=A0A4C1V574_EUMVA|nr:hypothetical protein EVAR_6765_1 [Eumeta japonica]
MAGKMTRALGSGGRSGAGARRPKATAPPHDTARVLFTLEASTPVPTVAQLTTQGAEEISSGSSSICNVNKQKDVLRTQTEQPASLKPFGLVHYIILRFEFIKFWLEDNALDHWITTAQDLQIAYANDSARQRQRLDISGL